MAKNQKRSNNEGNIRERKDGRWEVRITSGIDFRTGKAKRISKLAHTKPEAIALLQESVYDIRVNGYKDPTDVTLEQWYKFWLETHMANSLKRSTYISYEGYLTNHFAPTIGSTKLKNLTGKLLQELYNFKMENGMSAKTVRNMNLALHKCLDLAVKENLMMQNPSEMITLPRQEDKEIEVLTNDQQTNVVRASYNHRYGVFIRLTLCTGLRLGELLALKWEDIDLKGGNLTVRRTINRLKTNDPNCSSKTKIYFDTPKTKNARRKIPLPNNALQDLLRWKSVQSNDNALAGDSYADTGFIVTNEMGGYIEQKTFKKYYDRILKSFNVGHYTFHALRHTFATRALEKGMDYKTLSDILGHYSVSFTLDTYAHVLDEHKRKGMDLMDDIYDISGIETAEYRYPLIFTPHNNGYTITSPDFPELNITSESIDKGMGMAKEQMKNTNYLPVPPKPELISLESGSFIVMIGLE